MTIRTLFSNWASLLAGLLASLTLGACASAPLPPSALKVYDLGMLPSAATNPTTPTASTDIGARRPTVSVEEVAAGPWFDTDFIYYRLAYANAQQPHPYAESRWTVPPPHLLTQRLKARLATQANVLSAGETFQESLLKIDLDEFSQVFDEPRASRGVVQLRASLIRGGRLVVQRTFAVERPAPSADAVGGVRALTLATDALLDELLAWIGPLIR